MTAIKTSKQLKAALTAALGYEPFFWVERLSRGYNITVGNYKFWTWAIGELSDHDRFDRVVAEVKAAAEQKKAEQAAAVAKAAPAEGEGAFDAVGATTADWTSTTRDGNTVRFEVLHSNIFNTQRLRAVVQRFDAAGQPYLTTAELLVRNGATRAQVEAQFNGSDHAELEAA